MIYKLNILVTILLWLSVASGIINMILFHGNIIMLGISLMLLFVGLFIDYVVIPLTNKRRK